ncbi:unnamed protein product [Ilex paraguariensis]|uniref:Uncharacterized protein n=1 Tax=Ilex paraguariensis TaxID=185542 RepID=A0ABC8RAR2_9AQUA
MALRDNMAEGSISSLSLDSVEFEQSEIVIFPEDVAWADSCLIKQLEISDGDWNSLKDALLATISSKPDSLESSTTGKDGSPQATDVEILPSSEGTKTSPNLQRIADMIVQTNGEVEENSDDHLINRKTDTSPSTINLENVFLPTYNEDLREIRTTNSEVDFGFPGLASEPSNEDIFKVWDLDIPDEEDELITQLNKAIAESSLEPIPSAFDDSGVWKGLKVESIDDLIAGITELSLNQISG